MQVSKIIVCTLAVLAGKELTNPALANNLETPCNQAWGGCMSNSITPSIHRNNIDWQQVQPLAVSAETVPEFSQPDLLFTAQNVEIWGASEELESIIRHTILTRPGGKTSRNQLREDVAAILDTGLFAEADFITTNTPTGLQVVYQVKPVVVRSLVLSGAQVLLPDVANKLFQPQIGTTVSPVLLHQGLEAINQWYRDNGYILAEVLDLRTSPDGTLTVVVSEGVVSEVNLRFVDRDGKTTAGKTQTDFLQPELQLKPGQVYRQDTAESDLKRLFQLGLFEKVNVAPRGDARKVAVTYNLLERSSLSINPGGGYSDANGLFATLGYQDFNFGGINQQLAINVQANFRDLQFNTKFTNPYRASIPNTLGYSVNAFRRNDLSQTFNQGIIPLANGDQAREDQFGGGITLMQPMGDLQASLGLNYARTSIRDASGNLAPVDKQGNPLSFSGTGIDDLVTIVFGLAQDRRNNPTNPTQGSILSLTMEQSIPIGSGSILMNRWQGSYSQYVPINILGGSIPDVLAFNIQAGTTIGNLPPYQSFNIGGQNSVRGYESGAIASGRSYVVATAEYRIPIVNPVGAVLFADFASDLGSSSTVLGQPGVVRGKPGSGFGYGLGLRVESPIGLLRADFGINDRGENRFQLSIGERF